MWLIPLALLLIAVIHDLLTREIPDWISIVIALSGLTLAVSGNLPLSTLTSLLGLFCGALIGIIFFLAAGFGGGDVKLVAALGAWLGPAGLFPTLFWIAIVGMLLSIIAKCRGQQDLAYAPALFAGFLIFIIWPDSLNRLAGLPYGIQ